MRSVLFFCLLAAVNAQNLFGAYFVDWAQYRAAPYTHTPDNLQPIIRRVDHIMYSFVYFCPPSGTNPMPYWALPPYGSCSDATEYQMMFVETKDPQFVQTLVGYKSQNPKLKIIMSVGGWNFPSAYFSKMVSSSTSRQKWINSAVSFMSSHGFDGVDLDWEYPCSPPRSNPVEISCYDFRTVDDAGGHCPADTQNFPQFLKELRAAIGTKILTVASQAAKQNEINMDIKDCSQYLDWWHIMSYDYAVSDIPDGQVMSPNAPLNLPPPPAVQMAINNTVQDYLAQGVPKSKMQVGVPFYGHTWYQPSLVNTNNWKKFGNTGIVEGECCGPFQSTFGGKPGKGCLMCGTMMYSEILAAGGTYYYDNQTQSAINFWNTQGSDGYTPAGNWVTYNDPVSIQAITSWAMKQGLNGVFCFDTSMDTVTSSGQWTYALMNKIADTMGGH